MTVLGAISSGLHTVASAAIPLVSRLPSSREVFRVAILAFVSGVNHSSSLAQWTFHPRIANKLTSFAELVSDYATRLIHRDSSENTEIVEREQVRDSTLSVEPADLQQQIEDAELLASQAKAQADSGAIVDYDFEGADAACKRMDQSIIQANERVEAAYAKALARADVLSVVIRGAISRVTDFVDEVSERIDAFEKADQLESNI